jgi:hypothetical protein
MGNAEKDHREGPQDSRSVTENAGKPSTPEGGYGERDGSDSETETLRSALEAVENSVQSTGRPLDI